jgi:hypothetical protein
MRRLSAYCCCLLLILSLLSFSATAQTSDTTSSCKDACYREYYASSPEKYESCVRACEPACPSEDDLASQASRCKEAGYGYEYYSDGQCRYVKCTTPAAEPSTAPSCPSEDDLAGQASRCKEAGYEYDYYSDGQCRYVKCRPSSSGTGSCEDKCKATYGGHPEYYERCIRSCRGEPVTPAPVRCEDKCASLWKECVGRGEDEAACKEKVYAPCYRQCYQQAIPEDHSCEYECKLGYEACVKAGNAADDCREKYAPCIRACNPPEEKPPQDYCGRACHSVYEECIKSGKDEAACKEHRYAPCIEACHPPGLACGERCKAAHDDCLEAGKDPATCREAFSACVHACSPGEEGCPGRVIIKEIIPERFQLHYKCYEVEELEGPDSYPTVLVKDQFGREKLAVAKPRLLCTPARKWLGDNAPEDLPADADASVAASARASANAGGASASASAVAMARAFPGRHGGLGHFKCYDVEPLEQEPAFPDVYTYDQFGKEKLKILRPSTLCTPAEKRIFREEDEKELDEEEDKEKEERKGCREECLAVFDACSEETGDKDACKELIYPCLEACQPVEEAPESASEEKRCAGLRGFRRVLCQLAV